MDTAAEIKRTLREVLGTTPNLPITATVVSVEQDTCTIKLLSDLVLSDVRLKATSNDDEDYFLVVPQENSEVIVMSQTGSLSDLMVIRVDKVKEISYKQGGMLFSIDSVTQKMRFANETTSWKEVMQDLSELLKQLKVFTPTGPSGTPLPSSIAAINEFERKFTSILI